jgi:hypothetical protein
MKSVTYSADNTTSRTGIVEKLLRKPVRAIYK